VIILPTRGRPDSLNRFIKAYEVTAATLPVTVVIDEDNFVVYERIIRNFPATWNFKINKKCRDLAAAMNGVVEENPNEPWYALIADDVAPMTEKWDVRLRDACIPYCVAWGDDGIHQDRFAATHPFIGGDLVRAWGWLCPPYIKRGSADLIWRTFALELGLARYCSDVLLEHRHWQVGKAEFDTTYATQPSHTDDGAAYKAYINGPKYQEDLKRVRERLKL
jgi:hypothetical protein